MLCTFATTATAHAADTDAPGDMARRGRLFFDAEMLYWQGHVNDPRSTRDPLVSTDAVGLLGYRRVPLGFGIGYALSERLVVGGRLDAAFEPEHGHGLDRFTLRGALGPFVEITFARERYVRPFLLLRAGVGRSTTFVRETVAEGEDEGGVSFYPTAGAGLGTHVFLSEQVSFDAMLTLDHRWNFVRPRTQPDATVGSDVVRADGWTLQDGTISTAVTFGFSHWWK